MACGYLSMLFPKIFNFAEDYKNKLKLYGCKMKFGAMNNPSKDLLKEIEMISSFKFDYLELTIDRPEASPEKLHSRKERLREAISSSDLDIMGHLPCWVFTADLYPGIRKASQEEIIKALEIVPEFGIEQVVVHPSYAIGSAAFRKGFVKQAGREFLGVLYEKAENLGLNLCLENMPSQLGWLLKPEDFKEIFENFPKMGLTLDIAHANIRVEENRSFKFIELFAQRIKHVHVSDNFGIEDNHLPPGCGMINFTKIFSSLKRINYDDRISLEVFTPDRDYLRWSLQKTKELWSKA
jgi:sugar phosphate isomerase/epimerase